MNSEIEGAVGEKSTGLSAVKLARSISFPYRWVEIVNSGLVVVAGIIFFGRFVRLDPDFHHDGLQFVNAVAVSEGLRIHVDAFSVYGPVTAWIQGALLAILGPEVIVLRLQTAFTLTLSAVLLYWVSREFGSQRLVALLVSITWIALCPTWAQRDGVFAFWSLPSSLLPVFLLGAVLTLKVSWTHAAKGTHWLAVLSGVFSALGVFTRVNYMLPVILAMLVFLIGASRSDAHRSKLIIRLFMMGLIGTAAIILVILFQQDAIGSHVRQTILAPIDYYSDVSPGWSYFFWLYVVGTLPYFLLSAGLVLWTRVRRGLIRGLGLGAGGLLVTALVSLGVGTRTRVGFLDLSGSATADSWQVTWANAQVLMPIYAASLLALIGGIGALYLIARGQTHVYALLLMSASANLVQIYPLFDQYHLWWAALLPLAASAVAITRFSKRNLSRVVASLLLIPAVLASTYEWQRIASRDRVPAGGPSLVGMHVYPEVSQQLEALNRVLEGLPRGQTRFHCRDGLLSAWTGTYVPSSAAHVSWAFGGELPLDNGHIRSDQSPFRWSLPPVEATQGPDLVHIVCADVSPGRDLEQWIESTGLSLQDYMGPLKPRYDREFFVYRLSASSHK